jgi:regulator of sigma E protease
MPGDVFSLLGTSEWPSTVEGIMQIRANKGKPIRAAVMRQQTDGGWKEIDLGEVPVDRAGTIGFQWGGSANSAPFVAAWPRFPLKEPGQARPSGASLNLLPGSAIRSVNGKGVRTLADVRAAILATADGPAGAGAAIELVAALPTSHDGQEATVESVRWEIDPTELAAIRELSWKSPLPYVLFEPETTLLRASGPVDAIGMGLRETKSVMLQTYLTFARLFQGTVKVTHLKGPVGIAHVGTLLAGKGWIWLLFFMALVSVNLAVINFLPLPIVDGGQFLFLLSEQIRGRPVPVAIQSMATMAGLVLIGAVFLVVTFNDIKALFGG